MPTQLQHRDGTLTALHTPGPRGVRARPPRRWAPSRGSSRNQQPPSLAAPAVHSAVAAGLPPGGCPAPCSPPVRRLTVGHTCTAAVGPINTRPGCRASGQSPVTTKEGKCGRSLWAPGHPCGCSPSWPALHLTRPPQGRQSHWHAWEGISDAMLGHGTQGLFRLSKALPHWGLAGASAIEQTRKAEK